MDRSAITDGGTHPLPRSPRLFIYGHDTYGLGHLRRNLTIATELTHRIPELSILLLTGSPAVQQFPLPANVDYIKLPAVVKVADEDYQARTLRLQSAEIIRLRTALAREAVSGFAPDVVLVDHAPLGMKGELVPALEALRQKRPPVRVVLGLRDIVDEPERVRRNWSEQGIYQALERYYDALLIYGVASVMDVITAYQLPSKVALRAHYCGYLRRDRSIGDTAALRRAFCPQGEQLVLVTAGGGDDGFPLLRTYLAGLARGKGPHQVVSLVVTGPFLPPAQRAELEVLAKGQSGVRLVEFTPDLPGLMHLADVVICMGGYNTLCEVLSVGARALVIPRIEPRHEQLLRAQAFERLGLLSLLHPKHLTPESLAQRVVSLLEEAHSSQPPQVREALAAFSASGALDGLTTITRVIGAFLEQATGATVEAG